MIEELKYNGYTANPSDYECADGDLAASIGIVPEDGALKPVLPPKVLAVFPNVNRVFVHKNNYTHYIIVQNGGDGTLLFSWCDDTCATLSDAFLTLSGEGISDMTAIGHMLIVASSRQVYYIRWKDGDYKFLANSLPEPDIAFALHGEVMSHVYTDRNIATSKSSITTTDEGWTTLCEFSYSFSKVPGNSYSDYLYLGEDVTLEANTNYAFSTRYSADKASHYFCIEGFNATTGQYEHIFQGAPRATSNHYEKTPAIAYTKLRLKAKNRSFSSSNIANTLIIEKGATSASVKLDYAIENTSDNYTAMMAVCNSFVNKYAMKDGRFVFPFFVRYALRLYDGSYARISCPILMIPNSGYVPLLRFVPRAEDSGNINVSAYAFICDLQFKVTGTIGEEWEDFIHGIDIFVSPPVYPYDQGKEYDSSDNTLFTYQVFDADAGVNEIAGLDYGNLKLLYNGNDVDGEYKHRDLYDVLKTYYSFCDTTQAKQWRCVQMAPHTEKHIRESLVSTSQFHLVKSLDFSELLVAGNDFVDVEMKDGILESLVAKQTLDDELMANRTFVTGNLYAYNNRLHAFNATFRLMEPKGIMMHNQFVTPAPRFVPSDGDSCDVFVYIRNEQGTKIVKGTNTWEFSRCFGLNGMSWFYYPDNNAYRAVFVSGDGQTYLDLALVRHELLNGAYWLADDLHATFDGSSTPGGYAAPIIDNEILSASTVYVSEVNNPFTFPAALAVSIGCNRVLALATAAKALSTGQFGQFPLYAFTTEGVWALEASSIGTYLARQPFTRDVCINTESITQIDSAVLFATDRGIMLVSGSDVQCISDSLKSENVFSITGLPKHDRLLGIFNGKAGENWQLCTADVEMLPFVDFLKGCRMVYDYVNQRIIVYNTNVKYAYIFSFKSRSWGMMRSDITNDVNSYPEALAMQGTELVNVSMSDASEVTALVITRPFKIGNPDVFKTIDTIIQRGYFRKDNVAQVLYASNDLYNWYVVRSSTDKYLRGFSGTPYKAFRLALVCTLDKTESLYGFTVRYNPRRLNRPR